MLKKVSSLVHFVYSFSIAWRFCIINQIIQKIYRKMKSTNFDMQLTPSKTLGDHPIKDDGVKMVLSYRLQQNVSVELRMI